MSTPPAIDGNDLPAVTDWRAWLVALLFGCLAFALFTRHNDFPFYYHTDEPSKVRQVLTGERNFHHPLLLLKSTEVALALTGAPREQQAVVEAGRTVSAFCAALAVAALTLLAWSHGGALAGGLTGALLATHPVIFELTHYMKEDCALLAGVAACFVGMQLYARKPTLGWAAFCGATAGLAASGKYAGAAVSGVALLTVLATPRAGRRGDRRVAVVFVGAALLVWGAINFDALRVQAGLQGGLENEFRRIDKRTDEREGAFEFKYLSKFGRVVSVPLLLGAAFWMDRRWRDRRRTPLATWVLIAFPLLYTVALGLAPVTKERYMLPVFALFCVLGAMGIVELATARPFRHAPLVAAVLAAVAIGWHLPSLLRCDREFAVDDRRDLIAFMREKLPAEAIIAHDRRAWLYFAKDEGLPRDQFPQQVRSGRRYAAEFGTFEDLRRDGMNYVVACEIDYHTALRADEKSDAKLRAMRQFYERLFREGKLLGERPGGRILYLHPGLRLYELP